MFIRKFSTAANSPALRHQLLSEALKCVPILGWTQDALRHAATRLQLPSIAIGLAPRGPLDLIHFAQDQISQTCLDLHPPHSHLNTATASNIHAATDPHVFYGHVTDVMSSRLELMKPWMPRWQEALRVMAEPQHVKVSVDRLAELADQLCKSSSDPSYDGKFYMRRLAVGSVYASCELFMTMDQSPDYSDTFQMVQRRCRTLADTEKTALHVEQMGKYWLKTIQGTLQ